MIALEHLHQYLSMGFKLVPLNEIGQSPVIAWTEVYSNSEFWSIEKLKQYASKFQNIATTFGETSFRDSQGRKLFLFSLDIDSEEVLKRVTALLEEWKLKTFVSKTQKDCGHHIYWFEHADNKTPIGLNMLTIKPL
jgi:hypothetical protein